ncbi:MAG: cellulase family glycosylhydrolase [Kiritimatiellae bacterium]|nr:cellulase family glycosylhydrolase [Kiritimatiellia bacterium]
MKRIVSAFGVCFAACCLVAAFLPFAAFAAPRTGPWTKEQAWKWYRAQPWMRGCNYMPASAANRVDQWQELGSEERFKEVERELALAESIGFNTLRIIIEEQGFAVWYAEHDGFMERFERYLQIMERHKMRAIVVLGNDCSRPKEIWSFPKTGPQPCDWGYHGGRKRSQHGSFPGAVGYTCMDDPGLRERFFAMCEEVMTKYRADQRIVFWDLWNEPGSGNRRKPEHVALVRRIFDLAWKINPVHPLAADVWTGHYGMSHDDVNNPQVLAGAMSDIISYHCYDDYEAQVRLLSKLRRFYGRPLVNTEWLARIKHNDVFTAYPLYYVEGVGCTCWGFVAGKYQTYEPWEGMWNEIEKGSEIGKSYDMTKWFHDLYRPSLRPYDPKEIELIKRFNKMADEDFTHADARTRQ